MYFFYNFQITEDNFDHKHVNGVDLKDEDAIKEQQLLLRSNSVQEVFKNYQYDKNSTQSTTTGTNSLTPILDPSVKKENENEQEGKYVQPLEST
jgi:hypothetical protein